MLLKVGNPAPDFSLYNSNKERVQLSSLKGQNVVLLFFPLAFTSVCTTELCTVRDTLQDFTARNATVFGISVDSLYTLKEFRGTLHLPYELLSDFNKDVSRAYGTLYEEFGFGMKGVSKRSAFVIDREGVVRYEEVLEDAGQIPDFTAISTVLESI